MLKHVIPLLSLTYNHRVQNVEGLCYIIAFTILLLIEILLTSVSGYFICPQIQLKLSKFTIHTNSFCLSLYIFLFDYSDR